MTAIEGATVLVTGGGRGLGKAFVDALYERGAKKVYATARDPRTVTHPDAEALALESTDPASVAAAAQRAQDVTILINNAAGLIGASLLSGPLDDIRREFEVNFYGPLLANRAFVPVIEGNGGGHILTVHSVLSWLPFGGSYSASKAALWSQTEALRLELRPRGINVTGLYVGYMDTDMAANVDAAKSDPRAVARQALDGVAADASEVIADDLTRLVKSQLSGDLAELYQRLGR
jgi:NAD(P)-dependent dehydrogenase (short-subunit alcohol dehydrogenase family)